MAGWDGARAPRNGQSSSLQNHGSRDIVSPLTMKLQQVWLQTQLRGSSRDLNSGSSLNPNPNPETSSAAPSPVGVAATTPSSSSESGDDSWGIVDSRRVLREDEDAVLQFIDMMLMEDQVEQQACLDLAVGVGAMEAELAELIQTSSPPVVHSPPEVGTSSPNQNQNQNHHQQASSSSSPTNFTNNSNSNVHKPLKKRGLPTEQDKTFQLISRVSILERQRVFNRNGIGGFPNRPPRLLLQRNESYTSLWLQMGLDSGLLDKLVLCGEAVSNQDYNTAWELIQELRPHAVREGNATQRVVFYFLEALLARMHKTGDKMFELMCKSRPSIAENLKAVQMILKLTPFLGLPHLYTNRIILDSIRGAKKIHIVDFGIMYGLQWPALFQMLAERREGPPQVRITGIDLPPRVINHNGRIRETGSRLKRCAQDWEIPFKFRSLAIPWESVEPGTLQLKEDEVLIICCSFKQTNLFDDTVIAESPKNQWLVKIRQLNPRVFIQCLASSGFGELMFLPRFQQAVIHHAAIFAAMDACISRMLPERIVIEHDKYGREIMNIIACEGVARVERSETHTKWNSRGVKAGLEIIPLNTALFEESKSFAARYNRDLTVGKDGDWLWLGWRNQIIHAYSAWRASS